ncbi:MAG: peptidylprolyl isomerase [Maricaulaceae bacterium]
MSAIKGERKFALAYFIIAIAALGAALVSALGIENRPAPESGVAAYVNGAPIPTEEYNRAIKAMQAGLQRPLTDADKSKALGLLIDEELIVQESVRLGLATNDRLVRKNLVQAMMRFATSLDAAKEISEADLQAFYAANAPLFAEPKRYTVHIAPIKNIDKTEAFLTSLNQGESFEQAANLAGFETQMPPRDIPIGKLNDLFGGKAAELVTQMQDGDIAGPVASGGQDVFIWLLASSGGQTQFEDVANSVETELRRRRDEGALESYVSDLRRRARIKRAAQ